LIDLPENALFFPRIVEPLNLPSVAVPVLIAREICSILPRNSC
jgi:hypothetical protein